MTDTKPKVPDEYLLTYDGFADEWISTSAMSLMMVCPHSFYLRYILKLKEPGSVRMTTGFAVHKAREVNLKQKVESHEDISSEECTDVARDKVNERFGDTEIHIEPEFEGKSLVQARGICVDLSIEMAAKDRDVFHPLIQPVAVEEALAVRYPGVSRLIVGKLDARETGAIRDLKTGKRAFGQSKVDDNMGLTTYGMLKYSSDGELITMFDVDNVVCTGKTPAKANAYRTTRTKTDYMRHLNRFAKCCDVIGAGRFMPCDPSHWKCSDAFCGFWWMCEYGGGKI